MLGLGWTIFYLCLNAHLESAAQTTQSQWPQKPNSLPWPKPNWSEFLADSAARFAKIFFGGAHCATAQTRSEIVWAFRQGNQRESFLYNFFKKKTKLNCPNISQIMNLQVSWDCSTKRLHPHSCHLIKKKHVVCFCILGQDLKPILKRWVGQSMILCILQSPRWRIHDLRLKRGEESLRGVITTSSETSLKLFTAFHIWITFCLLDRFENISNNGMANWPTCGPEDVYLVMLSYQCLRVRTLWKWMFICSV